ncbi:hypothetical protein F5Y05DRAFT_415786 [Hypoxylon sp. FL0543]|nr:hypothetical protein F5Y05DRAFT_415786 [Hypoxylon sp. FL0543]
MSHITTEPRVKRVGFGALSQPHVRNGSFGAYDETYEYDTNMNSGYDERYDGAERHFHDINEDESPPEYSRSRAWPQRRTDYTQIPTGYKPDMVVHNERPLSVPPVIDQAPPNYKPSALRWPFLTTLLFVILALIGLLAWALHALPVLSNSVDDLENLIARDIQSMVSYTAMSIDLGNSGPQSAAAPVNGRAETPIASASVPTSESEPVVTVTRPEDDFGQVGSQTVPESPDISTTSPPPDNTPTTQSISSTSQHSTTPALSQAQSDFGNVGGTVTISETTPTIAPSKDTSDYGEVGSKTVSEASTGSVAPSDHGKVGSVTVSETGEAIETTGLIETVPQAPTFVAPAVTTFTNSQGMTTTSTSVPTPVSTPRTVTLTDSQGHPTATQQTHVLVTPSVTVETDSSGNPTATATFYAVLPSNDGDGNGSHNGGSNGTGNVSNVVLKAYHISYGQYFIGMFLPTLVTIILAIPIRILDTNAKILQPWHELTHDRGGSGRESLCLDTSGWRSVLASLRSLLGGQALVFLTSVLVLASGLLIPLSAEAVAFDLRGVGCTEGSGSAKNCAYVLSVFDQATKATIALLALMAVSTLLILVVLMRWRSGVNTNPWSICGTASLALNPDVRRLFTSLPAGVDAGKMPNRLLESVLEDRWFTLGYFYGANGTVEYGIMLRDANRNSYTSEISGGEKEPSDHHAAPTRPKHHLPFLMLGWVGRLVFLFVLCGLLVLILYYNNTGADTSFERFMDSESFGVRFLFTAVGVVISFFWASFFSSIAILSPYKLLAKSPQDARRSILLAPPTNAFSGLWSAIRRRYSFLAVVALTSILSEFLTIFLSNIPYRVTQTFLVHTLCTWAAVGILGIMVLVVVGSFFVTWPHMPLDPSTIAGAMYYVCDSWMLTRFEGLSTMTRRDRDWRVSDMGLKYEFGEVRGASGVVRIGVDASPSSGTGWAI